jgi:ATP-binding cassette subfamily F protein 3
VTHSFCLFPPFFCTNVPTDYKGDFDTYIKTAADDLKNRMRVYQAYHDKRAHMMEFIIKFRANAKRSTLVQSRIKAVDKMDAEAPAEVEVESVWTFSIPNPEPLGRPIISIDDVSFDYNVTSADGGRKKPESEFLLQKVNFGVDLDSRIGILGPNGAGKVGFSIYRYNTLRSILHVTYSHVFSILCLAALSRE